MTIPQIWHPAPRGLVIAAATERWTRDRPAPDLVVYLWTWSQYDDGERPTRRQLARLFGWTEHHARTLLARVKADHAAWMTAHPPTLKQGRRPQPPCNGADLQANGTQNRPGFAANRPIAGVRSQHNTNTRQDQDQALSQGGRSWHPKP
jgi:hypothetical protein